MCVHHKANNKDMLGVLDLNSVANKWVNTDQVYLGDLLCACGSDGICLDCLLPRVQVTTRLGFFQLLNGLDDCED